MDLYCSLAPTRVRWLALLIAIAGAGPTSAAQSSEPAHPAAATTEQAYREVLGSAHRALAAGDAGRAALLFEQAAQTDGEHVEAEIGISRAYLAAGEYRRALSYAHLASGEHEDSDAALAWLSYLEDRAGYVDSAVKRLRAALVRWPAPSASAAALAEILVERGRAAEAGALLAAWTAPLPADVTRLRLRVAYATSVAQGDLAPAEALGGGPVVDSEHGVWPAPPMAATPSSWAHAVARGNGVIVAAGAQVLTRVPIAKGASLFVRNGLGHQRRARLLRRAAGVALLALDTPFDEAASALAASESQAPDGVRFCFVLGRAQLGVAPLMQISAPLGVDQGGSPIFDNAGRLIGLALGSRDPIEGVAERDAALGAGHFALRGDAFATLLPSVDDRAHAAPAPLPSTDELYERLLPAVVEVWVMAGTPK